MKNIIVAENRKPIQQMISEVISKEFPDCKIVGNAINQKELHKLTALFEADIIIANIDILSDGVLEQDTETEYIVIAEKIDESNVAEIVKRNVFEVILSDFSEIRLKCSIANLLGYIEEKEKEIQRKKNLMAYCANDLAFARQRVLYDLVVGNYENNDEKIKSDLEKYYLDISEFYLVVFLVKPKEGLDEDGTNLILTNILKNFQNASNEVVNLYHIYVDMKKLVIIFKDELEYFTEKHLYTFCKNTVNAIVEDNAKFSVNVSISSKGVDHKAVNIKYLECLRELEKAESVQANYIFSVSRVRKIYESQNIRRRMIMHRKDLVNALDLGDFKNAEYYMSKIVEESSNITNDDLSFVDRFYTHLILELDDIRREISTDESFDEINMYTLERMIRECTKIEDLNDILRMTVSDLIRRIQNRKDKKYSNSVSDAIEYIEHHYMEEITLEDVAKHVHLSAVHVSRIFNKETGESIKNYLNKLRIKKAKGLLETGKFRINEAAEKVGFDDSRYFSTVFKKYEGISPTEYLKSITDE